MSKHNVVVIGNGMVGQPDRWSVPAWWSSAAWWVCVTACAGF